MKIVILTDDYLPKSTKNHARMLHELALHLNKKGHTITIITPSKFKLIKRLKVCFVDKIEVWMFKNPSIRDVSKYRRAIGESLLSWNAIRAIRSANLNINFDLCINYSPSIFWGRLARELKNNGAFVYLVLRDFFPQWVIDQGIISKTSIITKYFRFFEKLNYKSADIIGVQSNANIESFNKMSPYKHPNVRVLYNWSNGKLYKPNGLFGKSILKKYNINDKIIMFYGGNIGHAQDMQNIVSLAKKLLQYKNVHFLIIGQGDEFNLVKLLKETLAIDNITLLPSVSQSEYTSILQEVHIGLFSLHRKHTAHNFPGKLLGYMSASLPVLGSVNPGNDAMDIINNAGAGLITINGQNDQLYQNSLKLVKSQKTRVKMGTLGKKLLKNFFSVERTEVEILSVLKK